MTDDIHPPNTIVRIDAVWVFVSTDETGEGVCGAYIGGQWLPLIAADEDRLASLRPIAHRVATETKKKIRLIKLTTREDIEEINATH